MTFRFFGFPFGALSGVLLLAGCSSGGTDSQGAMAAGRTSSSTGSTISSGGGDTTHTGAGGSSVNSGGGDVATTGTSGNGGAAAGSGGNASATGGSAGFGAGEGGTPLLDSGTPKPDAAKPTGRSTGCTKPPPQGDSSTKFSLHVLDIPGVNPIYLGTGMYADNTQGVYNLGHRPYGLKLPNNYDPGKAYPVTFGAGGCGGSATGFASNPSGGLEPAPNGTTIEVGLSYLSGCFNDGGPAIGNRDDTPEVPYFRAVLADVENLFCVDRSQVFVTGYSSGGWEAYTLGCAAADVIRGIGADEGGMRAVRPACTGPVAALLVAGMTDTENPIGPLPPTDPAYKRLGSAGSAPGRDDILTRNGCVGTDTAPWDTAYPACVTYTGCPAAYPVVWCALPGVGHNDSTYNGVNYSPGGMWKLFAALPAP